MLISRAKALGSACALALVAGGGERARAAAKSDAGDVKTLAAVLALERAAVKTYSDFAASKVIAPAVLAVFAQFLADHTAHRDALMTALSAAGASAADDAALSDTPAPQSEVDALETAYTLERALAQAHLGAVTTLHTHDYGATAASILGVETTHVALLGEALRKGQAYPSGFVTQ
jgi:hypothetical protein